MKRYTKWISLILILSLLLSSVPVASAAEEASQRKPVVQVTLQPEFPYPLQWLVGNYCSYFDDELVHSGIVDCYGNLRMKKDGIFIIPLSNGCAAEEGPDGGWALVDPTGKRLTPYIFSEFGANGNYLYGQSFGSYTLIDTTGRKVLAKDYNYIEYWNENYVCYANEEWKFGVDDWNGRQILSPKYEYLSYLTNDLFRFTENGKLGLLRADGSVLLKAEYQTIDWNSKYYYVEKNGKANFLNTNFQPILTDEYKSLTLFGDHLIVACIGGLYGIIDEQENELLSPEYYLRLTDNENVACFYKQSRDGEKQWTVVYCDGTIALRDVPADLVMVFSDVILRAYDGKVEIYDMHGKLLNTVENSSVYEYAQTASLMRDNKYAVVNCDGQITEFVYDYVAPCGNTASVVCVEMGDKWHLITPDGTDLLGYAVDHSVQFDPTSKFTTFSVDGKYGFLRLVEPEDQLFLDVAKNTWYYNAVDYCYAKGLMNGTSATMFSPKSTTNRAMLVTILHRLAGSPVPKGENPFTDVPAGKWYTDAVIWAAENGIVNGFPDGTFRPMDSVTREQIATILYRYSGAPKVEGELQTFPDADMVSAYAVDAMLWATNKGLITGIKNDDGTLLAPRQNASRDQIATIIMRFDSMEKEG